jgi:hypothetical protein
MAQTENVDPANGAEINFSNPVPESAVSKASVSLFKGNDVFSDYDIVKVTDKKYKIVFTAAPDYGADYTVRFSDSFKDIYEQAIALPLSFSLSASGVIFKQGGAVAAELQSGGLEASVHFPESHESAAAIAVLCKGTPENYIVAGIGAYQGSQKDITLNLSVPAGTGYFARVYLLDSLSGLRLTDGVYNLWASYEKTALTAEGSPSGLTVQSAYSVDTETATVQARLAGGSDDVFILILKPGNQLTGVTAENIAEKVYFAGHLASGGMAAVEMEGGEYGVYPVFAQAVNGGSAYDSFSYTTIQGIADAVAAVNAAKTVSGMEDALREFSLELKLSDYEAVKAAVNAKMIAAVTESPFSGREALASKFYETVGLAHVNAAGSGIAEIIERFGSVIGIDALPADIMADYTARTAEAARIFKLNIPSGGFSTVEVFLQALKEAAGLAVINGIEVRSEMTDVLNRYKTVLGLDMNGYETAGALEVNRGMLGKGFTTVKGAADALRAAIKDAADANRPPPSSKTSGGGGGGSSGTYTVPPTQQLPTLSEVELPNQAGKPSFTDIDNVSWAWEAISGLAEKGVISGRSEENFSPDDFITREEFVKMLTLAFGLYNENAETDFADVPASAWYYRYVASAAEVAGGIGGGLFGTGRFVTRQEAVTLLYRALKSEAAGETPSYTDSGEISEYARDAVAVLSELGIVGGMGDGRFAPLENCTRAQAAKLLYACLGVHSLSNQ